MAGKRQKLPSNRAPGAYCGLTLAEWRGSIRAILRSAWWQFARNGPDADEATALHHAVVMSATLMLPLSWHKTNAGRFKPAYWANRRGIINARADLRRWRAETEAHES